MSKEKLYKVKIGKKGFEVHGYGTLKGGEEYSLPHHVADYIVNRMKAGQYVGKVPAVEKPED